MVAPAPCGVVYRSSEDGLGLDRSNARAGMKFADDELIGRALAGAVGRALADGVVQLTERATGATERVPVEAAAARLAETLAPRPNLTSAQDQRVDVSCKNHYGHSGL